jgi:hypothetical protein
MRRCCRESAWRKILADQSIVPVCYCQWNGRWHYAYLVSVLHSDFFNVNSQLTCCQICILDPKPRHSDARHDDWLPSDLARRREYLIAKGCDIIIMGSPYIHTESVCTCWLNVLLQFQSLRESVVVSSCVAADTRKVNPYCSFVELCPQCKCLLWDCRERFDAAKLKRPNALLQYLAIYYCGL